MIVHKSEKRPKGHGLLDKVINNLPIEMHLPGYQYCGPGTKLKKRLKRGDAGINPLDQACKEHDIAYADKDGVRKVADIKLAEKAWQRVVAGDASIGEKASAYLVTNAMKLKTKTGMALKFKKIVTAAKKIMKPCKCARKVIASALKCVRQAIRNEGGKKKVIMPRVLRLPAKIGGILPFLIPLIAGWSAAGALAGGAAGIAKTVNNAKVSEKNYEESKGHNKTMEAIALEKGLYLKPYKSRMGLFMKPHIENGLARKKNFDLILPNRPLTDYDLLKYAGMLQIPYFRGVFMRNNLPSHVPWLNESAIVNLDDFQNKGTHRVCYRKR